MTTQQKGFDKRAQGNDGNDTESQVPGPKRRMVRKRTALACEECRVRKRRCDGAMPTCSGCTKRMSTCVYSSDIQTREWHSGMIQSLRDRLEELENAGLSPPAFERDISNTDNLQPPSVPNPTLSDRNMTSGAGYPQDVNNSTANTPIVEPTSVKKSAPITIARSPSAQSLEPCRFEKLMKPIDAAIGYNSKKSGTGPPSSVYAVPVSMPITATDCTCDRVLDTSEWSLPLRRHANRLVSHYFGTIHLIYPILHRQTFLRQYEQMWESDLPNKIPTCSGLCRQRSRGRLFPATVHAVFSLASLFQSGPPEQNAARGNIFFRLAQKIDLLDILDDDVGIEGVQLGLLMGFYLQSTEKFSKCWNITGLTIRMAQNMGLQLGLGEARQRGILASSASQLECEMRIRVWYGCFLLDREISMSFGRPLMIPSGGNMIKLPEAVDDEHLNSKTGKWDTQPNGHPSLLESYIQTIKLYDILGQALDREELKELTLSSKTNADSSSDELVNILRLETKIMEWRESLPLYLQYDPSMSNGGLGKAVSSEGVTALSAHFLAQATRLYTRFLHIRLLVLRPALERLFDTQQRHRQAPNQRSSGFRLEDKMLSDTATQCMLCADKLVMVLDAQIKLQSFVAWWYNVSYLHTSGSTLLMGQLCSFNEESRTDQSFSESWDLCLQNLSRYTALSTIAKKSFYLLQESAESLRLNTSRTERQRPQSSSIKVTDEAGGGKSIHAGYPTFEFQGSHIQTSNNRESNLQLAEPLPGTSLEKDAGMQSFQPYQDQNIDIDPGIGGDNMEGLGNEVWNVDPSYWYFMPFSSQLETFPWNFDTSGIGQ